MIYKDSKYIYPPRLKNVFPRNGMDRFDTGIFMAEPKFDGSCAEIYTGPELWRTMNRHKRPLSDFRIKREEFKYIISNNGNNLIVGEYMNKSKNDEFGKVFNHKLFIFDILVLDDEHLLGSTFQKRYAILNEMLDIIGENDYSYKITENIYLTKAFYSGFGELWDKFIKIDMIEGLVLKRKLAKLEPGDTELNNTRSQLKCRRATKNYNH
jgi:hypothetical protein